MAEELHVVACHKKHDKKGESAGGMALPRASKPLLYVGGSPDRKTECVLVVWGGGVADLKEMEEEVRSIKKDGLLWGACEFPLFLLPFVLSLIPPVFGLSHVFEGQFWFV